MPAVAGALTLLLGFGACSAPPSKPAPDPGPPARLEIPESPTLNVDDPREERINQLFDDIADERQRELAALKQRRAKLLVPKSKGQAASTNSEPTNSRPTGNATPDIPGAAARAAAPDLLPSAPRGTGRMGAEDQSGGAHKLTEQNLTRDDRVEWCAVSVPFARGAVPAGTTPQWHVDGTPTTWQPFGAAWDDGSVRTALCMFRTALTGGAMQSMPLIAGAGPTMPDSWGSIAPPTAEPFVFEAQLAGDETVRESTPEFVEWLEQNEARHVALYRGRINGTGLVVELVLVHWRGQRHGEVHASVFFSDSQTVTMQENLTQVALRVTGQRAMFRHGNLLGTTEEMLETGNRVVLLRDTHLGDGQGIRRSGVHVPLEPLDDADQSTLRAAIASPIYGVSSAWVQTAAFGPFGIASPLPVWLKGSGGVSTLASKQQEFAAASKRKDVADPFRVGPFGLAKYAGQTGDQTDFGLDALAPVVRSGVPSLLHEVELSVLQEANRPVHFFEPDASPVASASHPDWVVWSGRTHWHPNVSKDRLGKGEKPAKFDSHGWSGKDRQHWSTNHPAAFYTLTGHHGALLELQNEARLYLAAQTVDPRFSTSGTGAPRGAGRTLQAASWLWLCTGDEALRSRMRERLDKIHLPGWLGRELPEANVRPFQVASPDNRILKGECEYWIPWQEGIAVTGFAAAYCVTGNESAHTLVRELSLNLLNHGWIVTPKRVVGGYAIRWIHGGVALTREQLVAEGPTDVQWSEGLSRWGLPAIEIARHFAEAAGNTELTTKAQSILSAYSSPGKPPTDRMMGRTAVWTGMQWPPPILQSSEAQTTGESK